MKAVKVVEPFDIQIVEVEEPVIEKTGQVKVKITSMGICGSDIQIYNGTNSLATYPRIIGHEFGGIVVDVGSEVEGVKIGDRVSVDPVVSCGECYACSIGRPNVCTTLEVYGVHRDGGCCEYVVVDQANIYINNDCKDESLLGLVEPYSIGAQINLRGNISEGDMVLIMGSGPIGLCALEYALSNKAKVMMTDIIDSRLERAKAIGATWTVNVANEDLTRVINEVTNGEGMPVVVDTICMDWSMEEAVEHASAAGRLVVIGLKNMASKITQVSITKKELTIVGSRLNNHRFSEVIEKMASGSIDPNHIKTHEVDYKDIEEVFHTIKEYPETVVKAVVRF